MSTSFAMCTSLALSKALAVSTPQTKAFSLGIRPLQRFECAASEGCKPEWYRGRMTPFRLRRHLSP